MVASGELAAGIGIPAGTPGLISLLPDVERAGYGAPREWGLYPINHLVVVHDELLEAHPGLTADLFGAYAKAKDQYVTRLRDSITHPCPVDRVYQLVMAITGADRMPYGIAPNRALIDQLIRCAVTQRILAQPVATDEIFADGTRDLTA
jgi:4,5-dihydroxyphthalate decarboxylase